MTTDSVDEPTSGAVLALAPSPEFTRDGTIFAATMAGLYRSPDGGRTWTMVEIIGQAIPLLSAAISPAFADDGLLLAGAVEGGLLRGTAGGTQWSLANFGGHQPHCPVLALSPEFRQDGIAFAGTMNDGIAHSRTRGEHWEARNFGLHDLNVLALAVSPTFARDETLYAATPSGVFRSPNGARAWRATAAPTADAPVQCLAIAASAEGPGTLFAGTDGAGVFRSEDRGATWQATGAELADACINALAISSAGRQDYVVFALTDAALYQSRDGGAYWERCVEAAGALCLAVTPDVALIGLAEHGIARSTDLTSWETIPVA